MLAQIREAEEDAPTHHHMVTFLEEEGKDEDMQGGFQTEWEDSAANDFIHKLHNSGFVVCDSIEIFLFYSFQS